MEEQTPLAKRQIPAISFISKKSALDFIFIAHLISSDEPVPKHGLTSFCCSHSQVGIKFKAPAYSPPR